MVPGIRTVQVSSGDKASPIPGMGWIGTGDFHFADARFICLKGNNDFARIIACHHGDKRTLQNGKILCVSRVIAETNHAVVESQVSKIKP